MIKNIIDRDKTKLIVLGGGGYDPMAAALCWASVINELAELELDLNKYDDECEKEPYEDNNVMDLVRQVIAKLTSVLNFEESEKE